MSSKANIALEVRMILHILWISFYLLVFSMQKKTKKPLAKKAVKRSSIAVTPAKKIKKSIRLKILANANIAAFVAVIIINFQAVNLPIGGMTTGALSDLYPNLFTPTGLTFSIRGLIYLALFGFVIRQMVDLFKKKSL